METKTFFPPNFKWLFLDICQVQNTLKSVLISEYIEYSSPKSGLLYMTWVSEILCLWLVEKKTPG